MAEKITSNHLQQNIMWDQYSISQVVEDDQVEDEDGHEDEANEYTSECSSDPNESDAKEGYLEQNTISCDQLCADHSESALY